MELQAFFVQCAEQCFDLANYYLQIIGELASNEDYISILADDTDRKRCLE